MPVPIEEVKRKTLTKRKKERESLLLPIHIPFPRIILSVFRSLCFSPSVLPQALTVPSKLTGRAQPCCRNLLPEKTPFLPALLPDPSILDPFFNIEEFSSIFSAINWLTNHSLLVWDPQCLGGKKSVYIKEIIFCLLS